jgi:hypothetical protein
MSSGDNNQ